MAGWAEAPKGNEIADVVKIEWDQISLQDKLDQFFKKHEGSKKDVVTNKVTTMLNNSTEKNTYAYRYYLARFNKILVRQQKKDYIERLADEIKNNSGRDKLNWDEHKAIQELWSEIKPFVLDIYLESASNFKNYKEEVDDILSTINTKLEKLNSEDKQTFLVGLEQKIEGNFQKYVQSEESAGEALYQALRMANHTEFVNIVQNVEKVSQAKSFAEAVEVSDSETKSLVTWYFGKTTQETVPLKQM